jgi:hypothetical protein
MSTTFVDGAPDKGDPATYTVVAVGRNGAGVRSQPVTYGGPVKLRKPEED